MDKTFVNPRDPRIDPQPGDVVKSPKCEWFRHVAEVSGSHIGFYSNIVYSWIGPFVDTREDWRENMNDWEVVRHG